VKFGILIFHNLHSIGKQKMIRYIMMVIHFTWIMIIVLI